MIEEREREKGTVQILRNRKLTREAVSPENRFAYNKPKRLLREIAFLQTEAFDVASPF